MSSLANGFYQQFEGVKFSMGSVYSENFVETINMQAEEANWASDYINEIFMYFFLKRKENVAALKKRGHGEVIIKAFCPDWSVHVASAKETGLMAISGTSIAYFFLNILLFVFSFAAILVSSLVLPIWVLLSSRKVSQEFGCNISIIRTPAAYSKMSYLENTSRTKFYFDDLVAMKSSGSSMYSSGTLPQRMLMLLAIPLMVVRDCIFIAGDSKNLLGWHQIGFVLAYYVKRTTHKCVFEYFLNILLQEQMGSLYYTGNKEDRFAVLENRLCKKYGVKSVCIPHGIEFSFKVPAGLAGDVFFCTTLYAKEHLSKLYGNDDKFIYDKDTAKKMFSRGQAVADIEHIVFFPESREPSINLSIIKTLVESGFSFSVKLHIKDNPENYKEYSNSFSYVDDFDFAISNKICLARKSTVLVEAIYNNSIPIAVLTDPKDRAYVEYMFPSLKDSQIKRVCTSEGLVKQLNELKENIASDKSHTSSQEVG